LNLDRGDLKVKLTLHTLRVVRNARGLKTKIRASNCVTRDRIGGLLGVDAVQLSAGASTCVKACQAQE